MLLLLQVLVSPLADNPVRQDLDFEVPSCYKHTPPRLQPGYLAKFKEETLFYIFYSMPQVCFGGRNAIDPRS
jgi:CCR4-NOT transcription complex subunit 2